MRNFLRRIGLFCLLQCAIGTLLIVNSFQQSRYGYFAAFEDKLNLLREHDEPNLIILGGSNVAFGIDSVALEDRFGIPVINGGLHSEMGLEFYLDVAEHFAKRGDQIILMPEWHLLAGKLDPTDLQMKKLIRQSPSVWPILLKNSSFDFKSFVDNHALGELAYIVKSGISIPSKSRNQRKSNKAKMPGVYSRLNFNQNGDFVGHHQLGTKTELVNLPGGFTDVPEQYAAAVGQINACAETLANKGATLYLAYCPVPEHQYENSKSRIEAGHKFLTCHLNIPILHEPKKIIFPISFFYDTVCHLNLKGKTVRTAHVAHSLEKQIQSSKSARSKKDLQYR